MSYFHQTTDKGASGESAQRCPLATDRPRFCRRETSHFVNITAPDVVQWFRGGIWTAGAVRGGKNNPGSARRHFDVEPQVISGKKEKKKKKCSESSCVPLCDAVDCCSTAGK